VLSGGILRRSTPSFWGIWGSWLGFAGHAWLVFRICNSDDLKNFDEGKRSWANVVDISNLPHLGQGDALLWSL